MLVTPAKIEKEPFVAAGHTTIVLISLVYTAPPTDLYFSLSVATFMTANLLQLENVLSPIVVTLLGISMLVRPVQPLNAQSPIVVTLSGISMLVRPAQRLNA